MPDRTIPYYNVIMRCDQFLDVSAPPPPGFLIRSYRPGDERAWAEMEAEIGDFASSQEALSYFQATYFPQITALQERSHFAVRVSDGQVAGSVIAWQDPRGNALVASLHWLVVSPRFQRLGLGLALTKAALDTYQQLGQLPIYLHTQPWSYPAIRLYSRMGFALQKTDTFSHYENQFPQAAETLKGLLSEKDYRLLMDNAR